MRCKIKKLLNEQIIIFYSPSNTPCSSDESVQIKILGIIHSTTKKLSTLLLILVCIFPNSDWLGRHTPYLFVFSLNIGKWRPVKLQIRTLFTQYYSYFFACYLVQPPSTKFLLMNKHIVFRWFYTSPNVSRMLRRYRFFFFAHADAQKGFFTDTLLECQSRWNLEIIWTFPLPTNVAFFKPIIFV